jgi:hypothetical protein
MKSKAKKIQALLQKRQRQQRRAALAVCLISLLCGLWLVFYIPVPRGYKRATGQVSSEAAIKGVDGNAISYFSRITFVAAGGSQHSFNGDEHNGPTHNKGGNVAVAYLPANPNVARDLSDHATPKLAYVFLTIPIMAFVVWFIWRFRRWYRAEDVPADVEDVAEAAKEKLESVKKRAG